MRVSMVIGTLERGGAEHQLSQLAIRLRQRGADVEVVTLNGRGPLQELLEAQGVSVICLAPTNPLSTSKLKAAVRAAIVGRRLHNHWRVWRPDAVHAWLPAAQAISLPVARELGIPVRIMSIRSERRAAQSGWLLDRLLQVAAASATVVTANSRAVAADTGWPSSPSDRILILNGVERADVLADVSHQPPAGVVVANLIHYKGHADLLRALAISSARPSMTLIGDGPERQALERMAVDLDVDSLVTFLGSVPDPRAALPEFQFAVLASHSEGLPNALLEAAAAGLPMVGTAVGGTATIVREGISGLLVPPRNPAALAVALDRIVTDVVLRTQLAAGARATAADFSWDRVVDAYVDVYTGATEGTKRG